MINEQEYSFIWYLKSPDGKDVKYRTKVMANSKEQAKLKVREFIDTKINLVVVEEHTKTSITDDILDSIFKKMDKTFDVLDKLFKNEKYN